MLIGWKHGKSLDVMQIRFRHYQKYFSLWRCNHACKNCKKYVWTLVFMIKKYNKSILKVIVGHTKSLICKWIFIILCSVYHVCSAFISITTSLYYRIKVLKRCLKYHPSVHVQMPFMHVTLLEVESHHIHTIFLFITLLLTCAYCCASQPCFTTFASNRHMNSFEDSFHGFGSKTSE